MADNKIIAATLKIGVEVDKASQRAAEKALGELSGAGAATLGAGGGGVGKSPAAERGISRPSGSPWGPQRSGVQPPPLGIPLGATPPWAFQQPYFNDKVPSAEGRMAFPTPPGRISWPDPFSARPARGVSSGKIGVNAGSLWDKPLDASSGLLGGQTGSPIVPEIKDLAKAIKKSEDTATKIEKETVKREKKREEDEKKAGSFAHGFWQSALPGFASPFLKKGPGMQQQALGQLTGSLVGGTGRMAMGIAGGLASTVFQGIGGIQQALTAIPGGGIAAGMLGNAAGFSKMALEKQKMELELMPYLGGKGTAGITGAGFKYGALNPLEALSKVGGFLQAGGGTLKGAEQQGMLGMSFAAQQLYGVGGETSGAFLRAGRRGGMAGVEAGGAGAGSRAFTETVADAFKLGLEGSELTSYMKSMAEGISRWEQTGIPVARESIASMAGGLAGMGIGGARGVNVATSMAGVGQGLAMRGPKNMSELMVLQTLGGYKGGGAEDYWQAKLKLEKGGFGAEELGTLYKRMMKAGGSGATAKGTMQMLLSRLGVNIAPSEIDLIAANATGVATIGQKETLARLQADRERVGAKAPRTDKDILGGAAGRVGGAVQKQAGIVTEQMGVGANILDTVQNFEKATTKFASAFENIISGPLAGFSDGLVAMSEESMRYAADIKKRGWLEATTKEIEKQFPTVAKAAETVGDVAYEFIQNVKAMNVGMVALVSPIGMLGVAIKTAVDVAYPDTGTGPAPSSGYSGVSPEPDWMRGWVTAQ